MLRFINKLVLMALITGFTTAFIIYANIAYHAHLSKPVKSDVMIVLGCQIWGNTPSWSLEYRLNKTLKLYNQDIAKYIIVSGGQGKDEATTEARVMRTWLEEHGIPGEFILEEDRSTSTFENLKFSKEIMDRHNFISAVIVSSDFHIYRALTLSKKLEIASSGAPAPTVSHLKFYYNTREIISVVKSFLIDK